MEQENSVDESAVYKCLKEIVVNRNRKALNYAVNYAKSGLAMSGEELKIQCLYVLNNITYWRGDKAKEVRRILKLYTKTK